MCKFFNRHSLICQSNGLMSRRGQYNTHIYIAVPPRYPYYLRGCITLPYTPHTNNLQLRHGQNKIKGADSRITHFQIILQLGSDSAGDIGLNTTTNKTGLVDNKVVGNFVSSMNCKYETLESISQVILQNRKFWTDYFFKSLSITQSLPCP